MSSIMSLFCSACGNNSDDQPSNTVKVDPSMMGSEGPLLMGSAMAVTDEERQKVALADYQQKKAAAEAQRQEEERTARERAEEEARAEVQRLQVEDEERRKMQAALEEKRAKQAAEELAAEERRKQEEADRIAREAEEKQAKQRLDAFLKKNRLTDVAQKRKSFFSWCYPLHVAVAKGDAEDVRTLLRFKADPQLKNSAGKTPLEVAKKLDKKGSKQACIEALQAVQQ
eukprot:TRINITY_DN72639_c0_g1_i1.p1 TRINITY_DN72639_c0_g1~~TRINITY_DN72639_c0_g1_i1.p1  ORF type:complete len:228 (+),score=88.69 TRINITY_DN72639_c0_g1_i1:68-751(+)